MTTDLAKTMEDLRGAIEAANEQLEQEGSGSRFTCQPQLQPGRDRIARSAVLHNYATNGFNISRTEGRQWVKR